MTYSIYQKGKQVTIATWSTRELAEHEIPFFEESMPAKQGSLEVREVPAESGGGKFGLREIEP